MPGRLMVDDLELRAQVSEKIFGPKVSREEIERVRAKDAAKRKGVHHQQQNTPHFTNCQQFGNQWQCVTQ